MSGLRGLSIVLATTMTTGCTLFLSGSGYTGGADGGSADASEREDGAADAGPACDMDEQCAAAERCVVGSCVPCDGDEDGFVIAACREALEPVDCDDVDPLVYPGAPPACGNDTDDACSAGGPALPFDEIGFFGTETVPAPPGGAPDRLRVFARTADEALLLFQIRSPTATPFVARPRLARVDATGASPVPLADALGETLPTGRARFDAQRDDAGDIRVALLIGEGAAELVEATFPGSSLGEPSRGAQQTLSAVTPLSDPALVLLGETFHLFVATDSAGSAIATRIDLADGAVSALSGSGVVDPGRTWGVSGRSVGILPGVGDGIVAWSGPSAPSVTDAHRVAPSAAAVGRPAVIETAPSGAMRRVVFVVPVETGVHVAVYECPFGSALSACTLEPGLQRTYPATLARGAPLTVLPTSESGIAIAYVEEGPIEDRLAIGLVETAGATLPPVMPSIPVPTAGIGPIRDLTIDFRAVAVPGVTGAVEVTATFAYIRQIPAMSSSIHAGGARVCIGVGGT